MTNEQEKRCNELFELGMRFNEGEYCKEDFNVHWTEITADTTDEWEKKISKIKKEMTRRKEKAKNE